MSLFFQRFSCKERKQTRINGHLYSTQKASWFSSISFFVLSHICCSISLSSYSVSLFNTLEWSQEWKFVSFENMSFVSHILNGFRINTFVSIGWRCHYYYCHAFTNTSFIMLAPFASNAFLSLKKLLYANLCLYYTNIPNMSINGMFVRQSTPWCVCRYRFLYLFCVICSCSKRTLNNEMKCVFLRSYIKCICAECIERNVIQSKW